jgi:hypothetical protein
LLFGVDLLEYNNFSVDNKGIVFKAGLNSRFKKLAPRLEIGRLAFITEILRL